MDPEVARDVIATVIELPDTIGLVSLCTLGWPMAELISDEAGLNLMSLEALAAAEHLGAEIGLAVPDDNVQLRTAADRRRVPIRMVAD